MEVEISKGVITKKVKINQYLIKDIFTNKELVIAMTGKECMHYKYEIGEEVYYGKSESRPEIGKLMTPTGFKYSRQHIRLLKKEFDEKYEEFISKKKDT